MGSMVNLAAFGSIQPAGIAALLCGFALMSLVMGRTAQGRRDLQGGLEF